MTSTPSPRAPQQERSRATEQHLLAATLRLLDEAGLDAAVVPRIAAEAGVAPASVYRRFADKDALLRAAFLHALNQSRDGNRRRLEKALLRDSLAASVRRMVELLFAQYRQHPHLMRALARFLATDGDAAFVREAQAIMQANADLVVDVLLAHRAEIAHAQPGRALHFALLHATCTIEEFVLDPKSLWHAGAAMSRAELAGHVALAATAYLQAPAARTRRPRSSIRS